MQVILNNPVMLDLASPSAGTIAAGTTLYKGVMFVPAGTTGQDSNPQSSIIQLPNNAPVDSAAFIRTLCALVIGVVSSTYLP